MVVYFAWGAWYTSIGPVSPYQKYPLKDPQGEFSWSITVGERRWAILSSPCTSKEETIRYITKIIGDNLLLMSWCGRCRRAPHRRRLINCHCFSWLDFSGERLFSLPNTTSQTTTKTMKIIGSFLFLSCSLMVLFSVAHGLSSTQACSSLNMVWAFTSNRYKVQLSSSVGCYSAALY